MGQNNLVEVISKLLIVQEGDVRLMRCQREIDQMPQKKRDIESEANQMQAAAQKAKDELMAHQAEIKKIELEIETMRQQVAKLRGQQFQIKSNEEFRALNTEISHLNEAIKKTEDREITLMEQTEIAQQKELKAREDLTRMGNAIKEKKTVLEERKINLETEVQQLKSARESITKDIAAEILAVYNRIIGNKKDQALVAAENSTCAGCHMHLPAHVICEIKKKTSLVTCSFCGRILYLAH